jgi:hypothetical protein
MVAPPESITEYRFEIDDSGLKDRGRKLIGDASILAEQQNRQHYTIDSGDGETGE